MLAGLDPLTRRQDSIQDVLAARLSIHRRQLLLLGSEALAAHRVETAGHFDRVFELDKTLTGASLNHL